MGAVRVRALSCMIALISLYVPAICPVRLPILPLRSRGVSIFVSRSILLDSSNIKNSYKIKNEKIRRKYEMFIDVLWDFNMSLSRSI